MKKYNHTIVSILTCLSVLSCDEISSKTKETINKSGEIIGETATELVEGISDGIEKTLNVKKIIDPDLIKKGLEFGELKVNGDILKRNEIELYIIFNKNYKGKLQLKAKNENKEEIGRSTVLIKGKKGETKYFQFSFNEKTHIELRSFIYINEVE